MYYEAVVTFADHEERTFYRHPCGHCHETVADAFSCLVRIMAHYDRLPPEGKQDLHKYIPPQVRSRERQNRLPILPRNGGQMKVIPQP